MSTMQGQAKVIDGVFAAHGVRCRVSGPPQSFQASTYQVFRLDRASDVKVSRVLNMAAELDEALNTPVRFDVRPLSVEVQRPDAGRLPLTGIWGALSHAPQTGLQMAVGETVSGGKLCPTRIDLSHANTPHVLIAGTTGSGKTSLLLSMLLSAAAVHSPHNLAMVILDPKAVDFRSITGLPHLAAPIVTDPALCVAALAGVVEEMERRKRLEHLGERRIVVAIDEIAELMSIGGADVERYMQRIISVGRGLGVHLIAATQKPTADIVGSVVKANFPVRMVGRVASNIDANVAAGISGTGAERLPGLGSFLVVNGTTHRAQAYHATKDEQAAIVGRIAAKWGGVRPHFRLSAESSTPTRIAPKVTPGLPVVAGVQINRRILETYATNYDRATGELVYGGMAAMIRAIYGEDAHTGGAGYRRTTMQIIDYLKSATRTTTTTTTDVQG